MSDSIFLTRGGGIISGLTDYGKTLNDIVIPDEIDGYAIEYISASVFADCVNLTSVAIPDSVIRISSEAFYGCTNLTTVYVTDPNNLSEAVSSYDWSETGSSGITFAKYVAPVDMLIKNTTLINLADKIRVLSGNEDAMTPAVMTSNVETFCSDMDTELSTQDDLIAQIASALEGKSMPSEPSGGGVEYEIVMVNDGDESFSYNLERVTGAYGSCVSSIDIDSTKIFGVRDNCIAVSYCDYGEPSYFIDEVSLFFSRNKGQATNLSGYQFTAMTICLINDPNAEELQ